MKKYFSKCATRTLLAIVILLASSLLPSVFLHDSVHAATTEGLSVTVYENFWSGNTGMTVNISVKNTTNAEIASWTADAVLSKAGSKVISWRSASCTLSGTALSLTGTGSIAAGSTVYIGVGVNVAFPAATPTPVPTATPVPPPETTQTQPPMTDPATPATETTPPQTETKATDHIQTSGTSRATQPDETDETTVAETTTISDEEAAIIAAGLADPSTNTSTTTDSGSTGTNGTTTSEGVGDPTPTPKPTPPSSFLGATAKSGGNRGPDWNWLWLLLLILTCCMGYMVFRRKSGQKTPVFDMVCDQSTNIFGKLWKNQLRHSVTAVAGTIRSRSVAPVSPTTLSATSSASVQGMGTYDTYSTARNMRPPKREPVAAPVVSAPVPSINKPVIRVASATAAAIKASSETTDNYSAARNLRPPKREPVAAPSSPVANENSHVPPIAVATSAYITRETTSKPEMDMKERIIPVFKPLHDGDPIPAMEVEPSIPPIAAVAKTDVSSVESKRAVPPYATISNVKQDIPVFKPLRDNATTVALSATQTPVSAAPQNSDKYAAARNMRPPKREPVSSPAPSEKPAPVTRDKVAAPAAPPTVSNTVNGSTDKYAAARNMRPPKKIDFSKQEDQKTGT